MPSPASFRASLSMRLERDAAVALMASMRDILDRDLPEGAVAGRRVFMPLLAATSASILKS